MTPFLCIPSFDQTCVVDWYGLRNENIFSNTYIWVLNSSEWDLEAHWQRAKVLMFLLGANTKLGLVFGQTCNCSKPSNTSSTFRLVAQYDRTLVNVFNIIWMSQVTWPSFASKLKNLLVFLFGHLWKPRWKPQDFALPNTGNLQSTAREDNARMLITTTERVLCLTVLTISPVKLGILRAGAERGLGGALKGQWRQRGHQRAVAVIWREQNSTSIRLATSSGLSLP